jgi:K+-sensing histidine kinase KdpD
MVELITMGSGMCSEEELKAKWLKKQEQKKLILAIMFVMVIFCFIQTLILANHRTYSNVAILILFIIMLLHTSKVWSEK